MKAIREEATTFLMFVLEEVGFHELDLDVIFIYSIVSPVILGRYFCE